MSVAVYTCQDCGHEIYHEVTSRVFMPLFKCPSSRCRINSKAGNPILHLRASKFQEAKMQGLAEHVPKGPMTVHLRGELTRKVAPGDVVEFSGIFLPFPYTGFEAPRAGLVADTYLSVTHLKKKYEEYEFQKDEETISYRDHWPLRFMDMKISKKLGFSFLWGLPQLKYEGTNSTEANRYDQYGGRDDDGFV